MWAGNANWSKLEGLESFAVGVEFGLMQKEGNKRNIQ